MRDRLAALAVFIGFVFVWTGGSVVEAQERFEPAFGAGNSQVERLDARQPQPRTRDVAVQPAAFEQPVAPMVVAPPGAAPNGLDPNALASPAGIGTSLKVLALMTVLGLVPSILMMTTCFVRFSVVLGLLRQAIGTQYAPPNQVLTALSLFLTFLVMAPVWQRCYDEGIRPYTQPAPGEQPLDDATAFQRTALRSGSSCRSRSTAPGMPMPSGCCSIFNAPPRTRPPPRAGTNRRVTTTSR